jgi:hypothetical protein
MSAKDAETALQCAAVMEGLMEVRRNMAAVDVVKMERDALKQQLQASQARGVQLQATLLLQQQQQQQQQQEEVGPSAPFVQSADSNASPKTFRALAMSEIVEKEQAMQQLQVALDDAPKCYNFPTSFRSRWTMPTTSCCSTRLLCA